MNFRERLILTKLKNEYKPTWTEEYALDILSDPRFQKWLSDLGVFGNIGKAMEGAVGRAYPMGDNFIIKLTTDKNEAQAAAVLVGQESENASTIYGVKKVFSFTTKHLVEKNIYAIVMNRLNTGVGKKLRIAGNAVWSYMDNNSGAIRNLDVAYKSIIDNYLPNKYKNNPIVLQTIRNVLKSVKNLYQNTGVLTQDTHGGNMALKGRNPAFFDFGRSQIDLSHPNVSGKRIETL